MEQQILVLFPIQEHQKQILKQKAPEAVFRFTSPEAVSQEEMENAQIILGNPDPEKLRSAKKLKWVQLNSAGYDNYVKAGVLPQDVVLTNASGAYGLAISEYMICAALMLMKKMPFYFEEQKNRRWSDAGMVRSIYGANVLVVGLGDIGGEFAKRAAAMGAHVTGLKRSLSVKPDHVEQIDLISNLDTLLPQADIVALSLPSTPETYHLINRERLSHMKPGAILLNVGRGTAVDSEALCDALEQGNLGGAYLDVTDPEPLPENDRLWGTEGVLLTPHITGGFHLAETLERIVKISAENLEAFLSGAPMKNVVNR